MSAALLGLSKKLKRLSPPQRMELIYGEAYRKAIKEKGVGVAIEFRVAPRGAIKLMELSGKPVLVLETANSLKELREKLDVREALLKAEEYLKHQLEILKGG